MASSRLDRALRLFGDVRGGEGSTAVLMAANIFLILCAYYFVKPLREGWIAVSDIGGFTKMEVKAYSSFAQSLLLVPVVSWYGRLSDRWRRSALITRATLFCMSNMAIFWLLQPDFFIGHLPVTGIVFYLWVGMFGVFVVAQFFAFAADLYAGERGERLMPLVALGATSGAWAGSELTEWLVKAQVIPTEWLLIAAMVPLTASIALTRLADRREEAPLPAFSAPSESPPPPEDAGRSALSIVFGSRILLAAAVLTLLVNWVNTNGENLLFRVVQEVLAEDAADRGIARAEEVLLFTRDGTTVFYSNFYAWVNGIAVLLQAFVASRILKHGGFAALLLAMPAVALVSYSAMALLPVLAIVKTMKIAENATDYSINNTARHVLWVPLSAEMKYKGKPAIDTLFARIGDGLAAATIFVGVRFLTLPTASYFGISVGLVVIWSALAFVVIREYRRFSEENARP